MTRTGIRDRRPGIAALPEVRTVDPLNAETPRAAIRERLTPVAACYVRDHFAVPPLAAHTWRLRVDGAVGTEFSLGWAELLRMRQVEVDVVLECAGNGRNRVRPVPPGLPWGERAVGCARFGGVPLRDVLGRAGISPSAREVVFAGADAGVAGGRTLRFERSLPVAKALHPDTLLARRMNGAPLTPEHGAPVRLVVPGWYGVASVKWLVEIHVDTEPFAGYFQHEQYVYRAGTTVEPVTAILVKSLITAPAPESVVPVGRPIQVRGWAWSGEAAVARVDVSADGGRTWRQARLTPSRGGHGWTGWRCAWTPDGPGQHRLLARATDTLGAVQPLCAPPNALGYGNNAVADVEIVAR